MAEHSEHIVSPKVYAAILTALLVGTVLTVQAAKVDLGRLNIVVALTIATIKMSLVILFFMHGKYSSKRTQLVIVYAGTYLAGLFHAPCRAQPQPDLRSGFFVLHTFIAAWQHSFSRVGRIISTTFVFYSTGDTSAVFGSSGCLEGLVSTRGVPGHHRQR